MIARLSRTIWQNKLAKYEKFRKHGRIMIDIIIVTLFQDFVLTQLCANKNLLYKNYRILIINQIIRYNEVKMLVKRVYINICQHQIYMVFHRVCNKNC